MHLSTIFKLSIKRVIQNRKKNTIVFIPLTIMIILILFSITIQYSMQSYVNDIGLNINMRTISGINYTPENYENIIEKLSYIDNIDMILDQYKSRIVASVTCDQFKNGKTDGYIYETPVNNKTSPEVIKGRKITNDDLYVIIIPDKIYADSNIRNILENPILEDEYINGENLLGQFINFNIKGDYNEFSKSFEVIGIYDSNKYDDTQTVYIPDTTIKLLNEELNVSFSEYYMDIVVNNIENLNEVRNQLIDYGILNNTKIQLDASNDIEISIEESNFISTTNINIETLHIIKAISLFLLISSLIILIFILITTNINKTYISSTELGILKIEGYKNKYIHLITILENIIICIISFIIALILFKILQKAGNYLIDYIIQKDTVSLTLSNIKEQLFLIKKIPQKINYSIIIIIVTFIILIESINTFFINKKVLKKNISNIMKL